MLFFDCTNILTCIFVSYPRKKASGLLNWVKSIGRRAGRAAPASVPTTVPRELPNGISPETWKLVDAVEGWLTFPAADFSWRLMRDQQRRAIPGCMLEIGVHRGRYLAVLAAAAHGTGKAVFGIDGFFSAYRVEMEEQWVAPARQIMLDNVNRVMAYDGRLEVFRRNTNDLTPSSLRGLLGDAISFASVDGGHDAKDVYNDMRIVTDLLADGGIIAADDVFNSVVPGVAEGLCRFLETRGGRRLAAFATCGNKLFLTNRHWHAAYLGLATAILWHGGDAPYLKRARRHNEQNRAIGFAPRFFGCEVVALP
jgi:hypothetical protein